MVILLTAAAFIISNSLISKPDVQRFIIARISDATGFEIHTDEIKLNLSRGIGIFVTGLKATSRDGSENIVASKVIIVLDAGQLIKGSIIPVRLYLFEPRIELALEAGKLSLKTEEGESEGVLPPFKIPGIQSVVVDGGFVRIKDVPFHLEDLYFNVKQRSPKSEALTLSGQGKIGYQEEKVPFDLNGTLFKYGEEASSPYADMTIETGKVPTTWITWPKEIPQTKGDFKARLKLSGSLIGPISVEGHVSFTAFHFTLREGTQKKEYAFQAIDLDFKSFIKGEEIRIPSIQLKTDDISLTMALMLDLKQEDPYLNIEIKSPFMAIDLMKTIFPTPILPPWIETQLFPLLDAGYARLDLLSIKGNLDQIEHLDLPQNQDVLSIKAACKNVKLFGLGLIKPIKGISAEIKFERGIFEILGLGARFGNSVIRGGSLGAAGIYGEKPSYEATLVGSFDIHDLIEQMDMDLVPKDVRQWRGRVKSATGKLDAQIGVRYETGWDFPQVTSGEFLLENVSITQKDWVYPLALKGAEIRIDKEEEGRINGIGSWGDSAFKVTGIIGFKEGRFDFRRADIYAETDFKEALSLYYHDEKSPVIFTKPAPVQISIQNNGEGWSGKGLISLEGMVLQTKDYFIDPPGSQDRIMFELNVGSQGQVDIKKCLFKFRGSLIELSSVKIPPNKGPIRIKAAISSFSLTDLGLHFKNGAIPAKGHLQGQIEGKISRRKPSATQITGRLEGKNILIRTPDFPSPINRCNFKLGFSGKKITIDLWKMRVGQSRMDIQGDLRGWDGLKGAMTIKSSYMDASDFISNGTLPSEEDEKLNGSKPRPKRDIHVKLNVERGIWKKLKWGPLNASLDIKGDGFQIRDSNVKMEHGVFTLKGHVREKKKPALLFSSYIRLNDQPLEDLLDSIEVMDHKMKGSLTLEAILHMKGKDPKDLIPNLSASSNVLIEEGVVKEAAVMLKVLEFLSLQKIFKKRPPDTSKEGFYFESVQWHAAVNKGQLKTDNFVLKSPAFNAVATGEMDIVAGNMDFDLGAQPLETIDTIVSSIPILGYILTGEDKSILTYSFKVDGAITDPRVTYIPFKNLGTGVTDTFKRLFLTPVRIFKDIKESARNSSSFDDTDIPIVEDPYHRN